mgnify:CR=1 FL=1
MTDFAKIEALTTNLVAEANSFLDCVRVILVGTVLSEPLTNTQKINITNRLKPMAEGMKAKIFDIKAELST